MKQIELKLHAFKSLLTKKIAEYTDEDQEKFRDLLSYSDAKHQNIFYYLADTIVNSQNHRNTELYSNFFVFLLNYSKKHGIQKSMPADKNLMHSIFIMLNSFTENLGDNTPNTEDIARKIDKNAKLGSKCPTLCALLFTIIKRGYTVQQYAEDYKKSEFLAKICSNNTIYSYILSTVVGASSLLQLSQIARLNQASNIKTTAEITNQKQKAEEQIQILKDYHEASEASLKTNQEFNITDYILSFKHNTKSIIHHFTELYVELEKHQNDNFHISESLQNLLNAAQNLAKTPLYIDEINQNGITPLMVAAQAGSIDVVQALLNLQANPFVIGGKDKSQAFAIAVRFGHIEVTKLLQETILSYDINNSTTFAMGVNALYPEAQKFIDSATSGYNGRQDNTFTTIVKQGIEKTLEHAQQKIYPNCEDKHGYKAIHYAVENEDIAMVEALLSASRSIFKDKINDFTHQSPVFDKYKRKTPLIIAAKKGNVKLM